MLTATFLVSSNRRIRAAINGVLVAALVTVGSMDYVVQRGDTLTTIARQHKVSVAAIVEANSIANPDMIRVGQRLVIPGHSGGEDRVHVVARGETLAGIAARYGVSLSAVVKTNDITDPNRIRVGQRLVIPGGGNSPTVSNQPDYHIVVQGDTLSSIAARYGITVRQLADANGITDSTIYVGTRLALSGSAFVAPGATGSGPTTHVVASGETLSSIAVRYGVGMKALIEANGIKDPNRIRVGQVLTIPGGSGWVCPVAGARYFNDWGFPRSGGRYHQGTDLFAARGTEVRAPVAGEVRQVTGSIGGLQFHLLGVDGVTYIGTHMDAFGKAGRVQAGEVIGYVGDSGNAKGSSPHLHFEMHPGTSGPVNPYPTLQRAGC